MGHRLRFERRVAAAKPPRLVSFPAPIGIAIGEAVLVAAVTDEADDRTATLAAEIVVPRSFDHYGGSLLVSRKAVTKVPVNERRLEQAIGDVVGDLEFFVGGHLRLVGRVVPQAPASVQAVSLVVAQLALVR